ncbi:MAG TPA: hypothetical protein VGS97_13140 [Actinocrinis sp.]|uniref:hypothetical protein n=1 Tax=Actinocrinis sp. TaxID=1920516 RepID=UPI002DDDAE4D|nr:hypothetical protein [Actinocrinis sp.]HEV2345035.1 hypothetical protein [Actinocrinis sp.]
MTHDQGARRRQWLTALCRCQSESIRWRIDYQIATPGLAQRATSARIERPTAHEQRWSDHAPVTVTFDV